MRNRVMMAFPSIQIPFLPPFEEFLRLTGFNAGMPGMIRDLGNQLGKLPPSDKTLQSAFRKNTTQFTANRILDIIDAKLPDDFDVNELSDKLRPWEELNLGSNGASWYPATMGLREFQLKDLLPDSRAEKFIHNRVTAEYEFLTELKHIALNPSGPLEDRSLKENALVRLLREHTFVNGDLIEKARSLRKSDPGAPGIDQQFWQEIRIDFYYNLLAALSLDLIQRFKELGIQSDNTSKVISSGLLGALAPEQDSDGHITYPFARLLENWKQVFADNPDKPLSWRKLSRAIPHPNDDEIAKLDPDSQEYKDLTDMADETRKTRLREWRRGVSPQDEQLVQFVMNLVPENRDGYYSWLVAHIAVSWGKLVDQEVAKHKAGGTLYSMEKSLLFQYHRIWDQYRDQAADILAA